MNAVGIYEAKNQFSRLVALAEDGQETAITRHGRIVARVAPPEIRPRPRVLGAQRGLWTIPEGWDEYTQEDDDLWYGGSVFPEPAAEPSPRGEAVLA